MNLAQRRQLAIALAIVSGRVYAPTDEQISQLWWHPLRDITPANLTFTDILQQAETVVFDAIINATPNDND